MIASIESQRERVRKLEAEYAQRRERREYYGACTWSEAAQRLYIVACEVEDACLRELQRERGVLIRAALSA